MRSLSFPRPWRAAAPLAALALSACGDAETTTQPLEQGDAQPADAAAEVAVDDATGADVGQDALIDDASDDGQDAVGPADGDTDAAPGADADAGAEPDADADASVSYAPSPANVGWIGGACAASGECAITNGMCLTEGFPNGMCSAPCDEYCPDRFEQGDTQSLCIDGRPYGFDQGICAARCDPSVLPGTGCPEGYRCVDRNRYADPSTVIPVCVPIAPPHECPSGQDQLVEIDYPDRGGLWIPAEAQCGGWFDLVVMLHGINPSSVVAPSLGGGRHLEVLVRSFIDAGLLKPIILAEPVHFQGSSLQLYGPEFDLATHLDLMIPELSARGIQLASLSYVGHSGAGCDESNGLYKVLAQWQTLVPSYAPQMLLWGLEDVCYESSYHWTMPLADLPPMGAAMINMYTMQGDPSAFEANMFPDPQPLGCSGVLYDSCIAHATEPWCSYRTSAAAGITHDNNPYFFVREALPQVFGPAGPHPCPL